MVAPTAAELQRRVVELFAEEGLNTGPAEVFFTPRRVAVRIRDVPEEKPATVVEVQGPPKRVGFDAEGSPTTTAIGFARAQGKDVADIYVKETDKGEYVFVRKEVPAVPTRRLLAGRLGEIITTLPFPKTMRWDESGLRFSRPVRWVLCLLGQEVVEFAIAGLKAGNRTLGHRNWTAGPIVIEDPMSYEEVLYQYRVVVAPARRREMVLARMGELVAAVGGAVVPDEELIEETVNITEFPEPVLGGFNPDYLDLPREVLITALKMHQRAFSVEDGSRRLLPYFVVVTNTPGCDKDYVRMWYERAIESRLRDARFFVQADLQTGLEPLVEAERRVVWIEGLGSYYDKTQRLRELCRYLAGVVSGVDAGALDRAALLCKADLLTQIVREKEFTSLQGVMGGIYARMLGEPEPVWRAISEHYQPRSLDDDLPRSAAGALLSVADKVDNIVATYLTGNIPTGSEDPFAVRRQATGVLLIIFAWRWPVGILELVDKSLELFAAQAGDRFAGDTLLQEVNLPEVRERVLGLFQERLTALLTERGIRYDIASAVLATVWHTPSEAYLRAQALTEFRSRPEFSRLVIGQKRVNNILRGQTVAGMPDPEKFQEDAERMLWTRAQALAPELKRALGQGDYHRALEIVLALREPIDRFFDDVLVMCEDEGLRTNRLRLLAYVRNLFAELADFSRIVLDQEVSGHPSPRGE